VAVAIPMRLSPRQGKQFHMYVKEALRAAEQTAFAYPEGF
jgi:hypothetical protein